jgi:type IV pilus assembly protein PilB
MKAIQNEVLSFLVKEGTLSLEKAQEIEEKSLQGKKSIDELIIQEGGLSEEELTQAKGRLWHFPYVDLTVQAIDTSVLNLIPKNVAANYQMIAFAKLNQELQVALVDPFNYQAIQAVEFLANEANLKVKYFITSLTSFKTAFQNYELLRREVAEVLETTQLQPPEKIKLEEKQPLEEVIKSAPVSRIVAVIMRHAVEGKASDIHIEPVGGETRIRYRIDGILHTSLVLPGYLHSSIVSRIKVLANLRLDETRIPQDGRIRETFNGHTIDFRVSTLPLQEGQEKVVIRILDTSAGIPTLEELGFREEHIQILEKNIKRPYGLLLVSGPTGAGKSTTLYSLLNILNTESQNIVTLEDPIEYFIKGVNQSQIRPEVGFTFANGLRSILRQDPNIIMVGEIRDNETAMLAVHAALTGHLILSTIHTNNALGAIPRLLDMQVEPFLLSATLNLVIAQRLARKICPDCRVEAKIPPSMENEIKKEISLIPKRYLPKNFDLTKMVFYKGKGCPHCGGRGYRGRLAVAEVLQITENLSRIITNGFNLEEAKKEVINQEMITLKQDALLKALDGLITLPEVLRVSQE